MLPRLFVNSIIVICLAIVITGAVYMRSVLSSGTVAIAPLETIHAIPYPLQNGVTLVNEKLAHADIFLQAPVFAKKLSLTVTFDPKNTTSIDAGIRSGSFWLGYDKQSLYKKGVDSVGIQKKTLVFPLTASFEDTNQSIDLMFFGQSAQSTTAVEEDETDTVSWSVSDIHATVHPMLPSKAQVKDYIKSLWNREREI